jgi:hypothetical protein
MGHKEGDLNDELMLEASRLGHRLWRNNNGVAFHKDGSVVRYGVAGNGAADLLGFTVVEITPDMVGRKVAVFTAVEAKTGKQKPRKDQQDFLDMVRRKGGIALWGTVAAPIIGQMLNWMPRRDDDVDVR